jgi:hypothetical protein
MPGHTSARPDLMEYKAINLKNQRLLAHDLLMSEMTADPLLQCMERMKAIEPATSSSTEEAIGGEDVCVISQDEFTESVCLDIKDVKCGHRFHEREETEGRDGGEEEKGERRE